MEGIAQMQRSAHSSIWAFKPYLHLGNGPIRVTKHKQSPLYGHFSKHVILVAQHEREW